VTFPFQRPREIAEGKSGRSEPPDGGRRGLGRPTKQGGGGNLIGLGKRKRHPEKSSSLSGQRVVAEGCVKKGVRKHGICTSSGRILDGPGEETSEEGSTESRG